MLTSIFSPSSSQRQEPCPGPAASRCGITRWRYSAVLLFQGHPFSRPLVDHLYGQWLQHGLRPAPLPVHPQAGGCSDGLCTALALRCLGVHPEQRQVWTASVHVGCLMSVLRASSISRGFCNILNIKSGIETKLSSWRWLRNTGLGTFPST